MTGNTKVIEAHAACADYCREAWRAKQIAGDMSAEALSEEIEAFAVSAFDWMYSTHPITKRAQPYHLWMIVLTAVLKAGTHPADLAKQAAKLVHERHIVKRAAPPS
jgi:hypothetical protein